MREELAYCVPLGIPHSAFLSWDEDDQDKALGFLREQAKVCKGCGTRQAEWDADRFAYISDSHQCSGCELLAQEQDNVPPRARGVWSYLVPAAVDDSQPMKPVRVVTERIDTPRQPTSMTLE